jgi:hypothetical protein
VNSPRERCGPAEASLKGEEGEGDDILEEHLGLLSVL